MHTIYDSVDCAVILPQRLSSSTDSSMTTVAANLALAQPITGYSALPYLPVPYVGGLLNVSVVISDFIPLHLIYHNLWLFIPNSHRDQNYLKPRAASLNQDPSIGHHHLPCSHRTLSLCTVDSVCLPPCSPYTLGHCTLLDQDWFRRRIFLFPQYFFYLSLSLSISLDFPYYYKPRLPSVPTR